MSIIPGKGLGRTIGFPTLNCTTDERISECYGVYIVQCVIDQKQYHGVANWGKRPTFKEKRILLEIYILDSNFVTYTSPTIRVNFLHFLRNSTAFKGIDELKEMIQKDVSKARTYLKDNVPGNSCTNE